MCIYFLTGGNTLVRAPVFSRAQVWEGKIRGRKEMINWADMDREDVLSKGLSGVMKVGRLTTNVRLLMVQCALSATLNSL